MRGRMVDFRLALRGALLGAALSVVGSVWSDTRFEFATASNVRWRVWNGAFADPAEAKRQVTFGADGMRVDLDTRKSKTAVSRLIIGPTGPRARMPEILAGSRVRLTCRIPADSVVDAPRTLSVIDEQGEKFPFPPLEVVRTGDRFVVTYHIYEGGHVGGFAATRPIKGKTGGQNRNDKFDLPLRLDALSFSFHGERTAGSVFFESLEMETPSARNLRVERPLFTWKPEDETYRFGNLPTLWRDGLPGTTGVCSHVGLAHASFPGPRPVPGPKEIVVTTRGPVPPKGVVCVRFVNPATGERIARKAKWLPTTRIDVNLPYDTVYQIPRLEFWPGEKSFTADVTVVSVTGVWEETAAEAVETDVDTGNPLHVVRVGEPAPQIVLVNRATRATTVKGVWRVCDFHGEGFDVRTDLTLQPGETRRIAIPGKLKKGLWRAFGELTADDGSRVRRELRFAVLDAHRITPRWAQGAHFRMGVNYHAGRFAKGDLIRTMDALAAAGVKLVRLGGFHFNSCQPSEGEFNWAKADRIMAEGEARGISFDAGIYSPPKWAMDPDIFERHRKNRKIWQAPTRPGLMRDYAEAVARRYGTKIDYYELGNEWDLVPAEILPEADAIRLQKEAWEGLKKGCPAAKLMPNGWTSDMTFDRPGMNRAGFQERYMLATKGYYDIHPTHMHSSFPRYVQSIERLLEQRKRLELEQVPWFSNETALTTVNGQEEEAALHVWKKILFAWAMGSVDYIWYNLKATGWVASDPEQAYGLITADYYPRATYAALSGLIGTLQGLDFTRIEARDRSRWVFGYSGSRDGFAGKAFAGWDASAPSSGCEVKVMTDAQKVYAVDLFGNRTPLACRADGRFVWRLMAEPGALLCDGATTATLDAADLAAVPESPDAVKRIPVGAPEGRAPDFVLATAAFVHDLYEADPANVDRTWKGPADKSAKIWLAKSEAGVRVKAVVTDDVATPGDDVVLVLRTAAQVCPVEISLAKDARLVGTRETKGVETVYDLTLPAAAFGLKPAELAHGIAVTLRVLEDDGKGPDGCLRLTEEGAPLRFVRFE